MQTDNDKDSLNFQKTSFTLQGRHSRTSLSPYISGTYKIESNHSLSRLDNSKDLNNERKSLQISKENVKAILPSNKEVREHLQKNSVCNLLGIAGKYSHKYTLENPSQTKGEALRAIVSAMTSPQIGTNIKQSSISKKYFQQNEESHKEKEMIRENKKAQGKITRKFGAFVEFSKLGPARSIACYQTRTNHLFNEQKKEENISKSHFDMNKSHRMLKIYQGGVPIQKDITKWKVEEINSIIGPYPQKQDSFYFSNFIPVSKSEKDLKYQKFAQSANVTLESDRVEQGFKLRSNLSSVISNIKGINLANSYLSPKRSDVQSPVHQSSEKQLQFSPKYETTSLNPQNSPSHPTSISPDNHNNSHNKAIDPKQIILNNFNKTTVSQLNTVSYNTSLKLSSEAISSTPHSFKSVFPKRPQTAQVNFSPKVLESKSDQFSQSYRKSFSIHNANKSNSKNSTIASPKNFMNMSRFDTTNSSQSNSLAINKKITMQAYNQAIKELKKAEHDDDKLMFDPDSERIKKKRKVKQKFKLLLLKCSKLRLKALQIEEISFFSTVPYQNKGSFVFLECVKKNQIEAVKRLLDQNKYYISDFDQFRLTGLHYACKKGNVEIAKILIENGAELDAVDSMKRTPLFYALINENKQIIKELLCRKCSPWSGDNFIFLKANLSEELNELLKLAKRGDINYKLTKGIEERKKVWQSICQNISIF